MIKKITVLTLLLISFALISQETMRAEKESKEEMSEDVMAKEEMSEDVMAKEEMSEDVMAKEEMSEDVMAKEEMSKDVMAKEVSEEEEVMIEPQATRKNSVLQVQTEIKDPFKLRDPFKVNVKPRIDADKSLIDSKTGKINLGEVDINSMKVVGVLVGKDRRVFAKVGDQITILKEGMELGPEKVALKAILPGGVVLVEKIINVYGQEEFLETIIPISGNDASKR